ncbi:MAG: M56 family metallopeptidase, partial [Candidatus Hydrogenedentales bacterium]
APCVGRAFTPVILLPRWFAEANEQAETVEWVLRHECMHVRHRDPLANAVRNLAEALFWFHPLVRWAGRKWEAAAERACDAALVDTPAAARSYAQSLYGLLENLSQRPAPKRALTLGASHTQVGERIRALLSKQDFARPQYVRVWSAIAILMVIAALAGIRWEFPAAIAETHTRDWDLRLGRSELEYTDDVTTWNLYAKGNFRFAPGRRGIEAMSTGAFMRLAEHGPAGSISLLIELESDNEPRHEYRVDGKAVAFNDDARDWMRDTLQRVGLN